MQLQTSRQCPCQQKDWNKKMLIVWPISALGLRSFLLKSWGKLRKMCIDRQEGHVVVMAITRDCSTVLFGQKWSELPLTLLWPGFSLNEHLLCVGHGVSIPHTSPHHILTTRELRKQSLQESCSTLCKSSHSHWLLGSLGKCLGETITVFRYSLRTYLVPDTELATSCMLSYFILSLSGWSLSWSVILQPRKEAHQGEVPCPVSYNS